jgi:hypothetical protein
MALFVGKLDPRVPFHEIEALFVKYGQRYTALHIRVLLSLAVLCNSASHRCRPPLLLTGPVKRLESRSTHCFVTYESMKDAEEALLHLQDRQVGEQKSAPLDPSPSSTG